MSVNLLRGTVECFGAGVGGADAVTILPHDELLVTGGSELGRRMCRNTQLVLIEESNLAKVIDMAGGSWYVEQLTDQLANAAWDFMQELERAGGLVDAVQQGVLQARVDATRARRDHAVATRKMPMTGVSEFPNIADHVASRCRRCTGGTRRRCVDRTVHSAAAAPLRRPDRARAPARRPTGGILRPPEGVPRRCRLDGLERGTRGVREEPVRSGWDRGDRRRQLRRPDRDPQAFEASGAALVCICASDPVYADHAVAVTAELAAASPARIYLAGRPRGMDDELADAGVDEQIAAGGDIVATLRTALDTIGAPS